MQTPALHAAAADSIRAAALHAQALADSAKLARLSAHVDSQYVQFLEKTNAGLSTWWTAAGVLLAAVGVLVAVGAVLGAVLMYRQSREFKQTLSDAVGEYQTVLNRFVEEKRTELAADIAQVKKQMEVADGERRAELVASLARLERERDGLDLEFLPSARATSGSTLVGNYGDAELVRPWRVGRAGVYRCSRCLQNVRVPSRLLVWECPNCHTANDTPMNHWKNAQLHLGEVEEG